MRSTKVRCTAERRAAAIGLVGVGLLMLGSCDLWIRVKGEPVTSPHQWSDRWGPMVPHTTFPADCSLCHVTRQWDVLREDFHFDHAEYTGHPLEGAHENAACIRCHNDRGPVQQYTARGCGGCHEDPHKSALGLSCERCHDENTWRPFLLVAEHDRSRFPLVGAHALADCESCHERATVGDFRGAPVQCHQCHQRTALRASPNHPVNGWIRGCEDCHHVSDWRSPNFDHSVFALVGGHAGLDCGDCHASDRIAGTPNDCYSCHRQDYLRTGTHLAGGFSTDCTECHDVFSWDPP